MPGRGTAGMRTRMADLIVMSTQDQEVQEKRCQLGKEEYREQNRRIDLVARRHLRPRVSGGDIALWERAGQMWNSASESSSGRN